MRRKFHLYVWDDVFCDYTCGMAFAIASSLEEAVDIIAKDDAHTRRELEGSYPMVLSLDSPIGFKVSGGS